MGRATRWLKSLFGGKKNTTSMEVSCDRKEKKRWSFKSSRDSCSPAAPVSEAWLRSFYAETQKEQSKQAIAVAAATAAAADAAIAAAQAAVAVVHLTSHGRNSKLGDFHQWLAAVQIQRVFRGYLAKKALRALKALVKLQALVRGYLVRKQTAATFHSIQSLFKAQATIRAHKCKSFHSSERRFYQEEIPRSSLETPFFHRRRLSAVFDGSPKIVQIDSCRPKSRSSRKASYFATDHSDEISSPLPNLGRISIPDCRYSLTALSTPRCSGEELHKRFSNSINFPNYMNNTQSFEAKLRSQSAPKQRPEAANSSKRLPLSELVMEQSRASLSGVGVRKEEEEFSFNMAVVGRLEQGARRDLYLQKKW